MTDSFDFEKMADTIIEDTLHRYPIADAPATLLPAILKQIQPVEPIPPFRLAWLDYALSIFAAIMTGLIFWLWQVSPIGVLAQFPQRVVSQLGEVENFILLTMFFGGATLMFLIALAASEIFDRTTIAVLD